MNAFVAIITDTWRQSVQQAVFLLLAGVTLLLTGVFVIMPQAYVEENGRTVMAMIGQSGSPGDHFERQWEGLYDRYVNRQLDRDTRIAVLQKDVEKADGARLLAQRELNAAVNANALAEELAERRQILEAATQDAVAALQAVDKVRAEIRAEAGLRTDQRAAVMTPMQKGVAFWSDSAITVFFWVTLLGFIAAGAGYFPGLLQSGAVDVVLSRPVSRAQLFLGKYLGGLVLYIALIVVAMLLFFAGLGLRLGVWNTTMFTALPPMIFSAALVYAIVALIGIRTRSTALSMLLGWFFLVIVDWALEYIQGGGLIELMGAGWLAPIGDATRVALPNFRMLLFWANAAAMDVPIFQWPLFFTSVAWLALCVGIGFYLFRNADY